MRGVAMGVLAAGAGAGRALSTWDGAQWPGLVIPVPDSVPWTVVRDEAVVWNTGLPDGSAGAGVEVEACFNASRFRDSVHAALADGSGVWFDPPRDTECGLEQHVAFPPETCGEGMDGRNRTECKAVFRYDKDHFVRMVREERTFPKYHLAPVGHTSMQRPRGRPSGPGAGQVDKFHVGKPLFEMGFVADRAGQGAFFMEFETEEPVRAWLLVRSKVDFQYPEPSSPDYNEDPWKLCKQDCSCTELFVYDKILQTSHGYRRRLRSRRTMSQPAGAHLRASSIGMDKKALTHHDEHETRRRLQGQPGDPIFPGLAELMNTYNYTEEGLKQICTFAAECEMNPNCSATMRTFVGYEKRPNGYSELQDFVMTKSKDLSSVPMWGDVVHCFGHEVRLRTIQGLGELGLPVSQTDCEAEINLCVNNPLCLAKFSTFLFPKVEDGLSLGAMFMDNIFGVSEPEWQAFLEADRAMHECMPEPTGGGEGPNGGDKPPVVNIPLESIPCACGDGHASMQTVERVALNAAGEPFKVFQNAIDVCFASAHRPIGTLQVQYSEGEQGAPLEQMRAAKGWDMPQIDLDDNRRDQLRACIETETQCTDEARSLKTAVEESLAPREVVVSAARCGHRAREYNWGNETGSIEECKPLKINVPSDRALKAFERHGRFPEVSVEAKEIDYETVYEAGSPVSYETIYYMELQSDMDDTFQSLDLDVSNQTALSRSFTLLWDRPSLEANVTRDNCHDSCACAKLFLRDHWDAHFASYPKPLNYSMYTPLRVLDTAVPCACSDSASGEYTTVQYVRRVEEYQTFIDAVFSYCAFSEHLVEADDSTDIYNLPDQWNWLCDCDLTAKSVDACLLECELVRGPWSWTCSVGLDGTATAEDGFTILDPTSSEYATAREESCSA